MKAARLSRRTVTGLIPCDVIDTISFPT
ncbi:hypothetical protein CNECB9_30012 [Cupriavidus necator]|uniref:Uncharacterized protein n=1 Tax=Cupriavidus necator TaxID=106590 RepID=A0A1K0JB50_CUPNE|nr:hypothetical protein CNECB9_30012 [Cupriavidus necator]